MMITFSANHNSPTYSFCAFVLLTQNCTSLPKIWTYNVNRSDVPLWYPFCFSQNSHPKTTYPNFPEQTKWHNAFSKMKVFFHTLCPRIIRITFLGMGPTHTIGKLVYAMIIFLSQPQTILVNSSASFVLFDPKLYSSTYDMHWPHTTAWLLANYPNLSKLIRLKTTTLPEE